MTSWPLLLPPYEVQTKALDLSDGQECYGFWIEQGLGKTGIAFADFIRAYMADKCEVMVVVAPFYLMTEWPLEAQKQGVNFPIYLWDNEIPDKQRTPFVYVINIEAARDGRGLKFIHALMTKYRCWFGIDESTVIKNFKSVSFKALYALAQQAAIRRELSGIPMPHNVMDLWPQLRFLKQLSGVNPYAFRNRFAIMGGYMAKQVKGVKNEAELHKILNDCSFRALKIDWAKSLPPKLYKERHFEMSKRQLEAYKEMESDFVMLARQGDPESAVFADQIMHAMLKMQQISRGFILDNEKLVQELVSIKDNPAINTLKADIETIQGKVLIFTAYRHSTRMVYDALVKEKIGARYLIGGMEASDIGLAKREFNEDDDVKAFVLQTAVGSRGHTLLGKPGPTTRCADTIFFENTYNYEHRAQGEDRNHRWGQDANVVTYTDYCCSSMDQKMIATFKARQNLVEAVLNAVRVLK